LIRGHDGFARWRNTVLTSKIGFDIFAIDFQRAENEPAFHGVVYLMSDNEQVLLKCSRFSIHALDVTDREGQIRTREVIRHPGAVVLLHVLDDGRVVMIENHRHSVGQTLLELPAGTIEIDEPPESTAGRELIEETGYHAGKLEKLHEFYSCPGICDELMHLYLATQLSAGPPDREVTEEIENRIVSRDEIAQMITEGKIRDAKTLVGLYAYLARSAG